jgi:hypothetical protein
MSFSREKTGNFCEGLAWPTRRERLAKMPE